MGAADFVMCSTHDHTMRKEKEKKTEEKDIIDWYTHVLKQLLNDCCFGFKFGKRLKTKLL